MPDAISTMRAALCGVTEPACTARPKRLVGLRDSTLPRQIRARNALVPVGKRARHHKKDTGSPHTPPSPHQEAVANALTKRVALGPWTGPFESHPVAAAAAPGTLYMDMRGITYVSLSGEAAPAIEVDEPVVDPAAVVKQLTADAAARMAQEGRTARRRRDDKFESRRNAASGRALKGRELTRRMHCICQPRKA